MNIIYKYHQLLLDRLKREEYIFEKIESNNHLILKWQTSEIIITKYEKTYGMLNMPVELTKTITIFCNTLIRYDKIDDLLNDNNIL